MSDQKLKEASDRVESAVLKVADAAQQVGERAEVDSTPHRMYYRVPYGTMEDLKNALTEWDEATKAFMKATEATKSTPEL